MLSLMESGGIGLWISLLATPVVMRSLLRRRIGRFQQEESCRSRPASGGGDIDDDRDGGRN